MVMSNNRAELISMPLSCDVAMIGIDDIKQDAVDSLNEQRAKFKAYQVKK